MRIFAIAFVAVAVVSSAVVAERAAVDVLGDIYHSCASAQSISACAKPKALSWLSNVATEDVIHITQDLKIVRTKDEDFSAERNFGTKEERIAERIMSFLESHSLKMDVPQIFQTQEARAFVPAGQEFGNGIEVPLVAGQVAEGKMERILKFPQFTYLFCFVFRRPKLGKESDHPLLGWSEVQGLRVGTSGHHHDRPEDVEGLDFGSVVACVGRIYCRLQVGEAQGGQLRSGASPPPH